MLNIMIAKDRYRRYRSCFATLSSTTCKLQQEHTCQLAHTGTHNFNLIHSASVATCVLCIARNITDQTSNGTVATLLLLLFIYNHMYEYYVFANDIMCHRNRYLCQLAGY